MRPSYNLRNDQTRQASKQPNKLQWLSHYYYVEKIPYSSYDKPKTILQMIKQLFIDMSSKFEKAVIYANSVNSAKDILTALENLKQLKSNPNNQILVINDSHRPDQRKQKQFNFALTQYRILITTLSATQSFQSGVIDVENVNLIVNQNMPSDPLQYKARLVKSEKLDPNCKGVVISMIDKNSNDLFARSNLEKSLGIRMSEYSTYSHLSLQFTKAKDTLNKSQIRVINQNQNLGQSRRIDIGMNQQPIPQQQISRNEKHQTSPATDKEIYSTKGLSSNRQTITTTKPPQTKTNEVYSITKNPKQNNTNFARNSINKEQKNSTNYSLQKNPTINKNKQTEYERQDKSKHLQKPTTTTTTTTNNINRNYKISQQNLKKQPQKSSPYSDWSASDNYSPIQEKENKNNKQQFRSFDMSCEQSSRITEQQQSTLKINNQISITTNTKMTKKIEQQPKTSQNDQNISTNQITKKLIEIQQNIKKQLKEQISKSMAQIFTQLKQSQKQQNNRNKYTTNQQQGQSESIALKQILNKLQTTQQNNRRNHQRMQQMQNSINKLIAKKQQQKESLSEATIANKIQTSETNLKNLVTTSTNELERKLTEKLTNSNKQQLTSIVTKLREMRETVVNNYKQNNNNKQNQEYRSDKLQLLLAQHKKQIKTQLKQIQQSLRKITQNFLEQPKFSQVQKSQIRIKGRIQPQPKIDQKIIQKYEKQSNGMKQQISFLQKQLTQKQKIIDDQSPTKIRVIKSNASQSNKAIETINQTLQIYQPNFRVSQHNLKTQLSQFIFRQMSRQKFLVQSEMYQKMRDDYKNFIYNTVRQYTGKRQIVKTKQLIVATKEQAHGWLIYLDQKPNILVLVQLSNGFFIGGFSQSYYDRSKRPQRQYNKKACLMSITNKRIYNLKQKYLGLGIDNDPYLFKLGNSELVLKSIMEFTVLWESIYKYFQKNGDSLMDFIGQQSQKGTFVKAQFHQIFLK